MRTLLLGLLFGIVAGSASSADTGPAEPQARILTVKLTGVVDDGMNVVVSRAIREAKGAKALIFIVDTPGGRVDAAINITDSILKAPCKTVAYVEGMGAISAGALITYSCDEIVMSPSTNMGAAQPVTFGEDGMKPLGEKETSFVRAKFAALAEVKGRNADIAMAMVDKDIELRAYRKPDGTYDVKGMTRPGAITATEVVQQIANDPDAIVKKLVETVTGEKLPVANQEKNDAPTPESAQGAEPVTTPAPQDDGGIIIEPAGKLLTLTPKEALKYGVIKYIAEDLKQLKWQLGYTNDIEIPVTPTWSENLYRWLISEQISILLLIIGIGGLYLEIKTPGVSLPGIIGVCALLLFFGSRAVVGLSDWLDILLLVIGLALIAAEVFVIPGFGIVGVAGIVCVLAGVVLSFTYSDFTVPRYSWEWQRLENAGFVLTMSVVCAMVLVAATWKFLPHTPIYGRVVMGKQQLSSQGYTVQTAEDVVNAVGQQGVATSMLRPAGKGRFGNRTLQVVSLAEFIEEGTPIVIVQAEGNRYVVDRAEKKTA